MGLDIYKKYFKKSEILTKLLYDGYLSNVLELFGSNLTDKLFLGSGGDATGFIYKSDETQVLKICTKKIRFFKSFETNNANDFMKLSRSIKYFVPINKILYDDPNVFVYIQPFCHPFKKSVNSGKMATALLKATNCMLKQGVMTKLSRHNLAMWKNRVYVFDYHGLDKITLHDNTITSSWVKEVLIKNSLYYLVGLSKYDKICKILKKDGENEFYDYIEKRDDVDGIYKNIIKCVIDELSFDELIYYFDNLITSIISH